MRKIIRLCFKPPVMVGILTLSPFGIYWSDYLSERALNLTRQVGFDWFALAYGFVCVWAFSIAYNAGLMLRPPSVLRYSQRNTSSDLVQQSYRYWAAISLPVGLLATIGLGTTIFTVTREGGDFLIEVMNRFSAGQSGTDLLFSPQGYISSETIPGIIRMLGAWSSAAVIVWLALAVSPWKHRLGRLYWPGLGLLLITNFVRSIIGGDRTPALTAFVLTVYVLWAEATPSRKVEGTMSGSLSLSVKRVSKLVGGLIFLVVCFFGYVGLNNLRGADDYNTLLLYADLGVANLTLAMQTGMGWTYGLTAILNPLSLVSRMLNLNVDWPSFSSEYIWSPPGNLLMYSYHDFHLLGFVIYIVFGLMASWVYRRYSYRPHSIVWRVAKLQVIYGLLTIFTVPYFTGPLYWAGLLGSLIVAWYLDHNARKYEAKGLKKPHLFWRPVRCK